LSSDRFCSAVASRSTVGVAVSAQCPRAAVSGRRALMTAVARRWEISLIFEHPFCS